MTIGFKYDRYINAKWKTNEDVTCRVLRFAKIQMWLLNNREQ